MPTETFITKDLTNKLIDLPVSSLAQTFTYDVNGNVETISVVYNTVTYVQTFTYTGDNKVETISQWVAQA